MSVDASARYSVAANLRWFALLFVLCTLAASTLSFVLIRVPGGAILAGVIAFAASAWIASDRFWEKRGADLRRLRAALAGGYVGVAALISFLLPIVLFLPGLASNGWSFSPEASHRFTGLLFFAIPSVVVAAILNFGVALLVLSRRRGGAKQQ